MVVTLGFLCGSWRPCDVCAGVIRFVYASVVESEILGRRDQKEEIRMSAQDQPESNRELGAEPEDRHGQPFGQQEHFERQEHPAGAGEKKGKAGMLGSLGLLGVVLLKGKFYIFAALKGLSFLKLGWLFKSFFMLFASFALYWALWGPIFAVIVVGLLIIHELGHYICMKFNGLNPKPMVLVPFLGAYVQMEKMPADQATDAWVSLAGPLLGGVTAAACYYYGVTAQNLFFVAAGSVGLFFNLLQLIPAKPLDGGFVISAINKWLLIPGVGLVFAYAFFFHSFIFAIVGIIAFMSAVSQFKNPNQPPMRGGQVQAPATMPQKVVISIAYFGLASMLGYLYWLSNDEAINMMPAKEKSSMMKYHRDTPDHEAFSEEGEGSVEDGVIDERTEIKNR